MAVQDYITLANLKLRLSLGGTAGTAVTDDDTLLGQYVTATNGWIEHETWRPIGPSSGTAIFDGTEDVSPDGRSLYVNHGVRSIDSLEVATETGGTGVDVAADVVLLPREQNRRTGWPAFEIRFKDIVAGSLACFPRGYGNIVHVGDRGWDSIPSELSELGYRVSIRAWHARNAGQQDLVGTTETGDPIVSRFASQMDWRILRSFRPAVGVTVG